MLSPPLRKPFFVCLSFNLLTSIVEVMCFWLIDFTPFDFVWLFLNSRLCLASRTLQECKANIREEIANITPCYPGKIIEKHTKTANSVLVA